MRTAALLALVAAVLAAAPATAGAAPAPSLAVSLGPARISTQLGRAFEVRATITNSAGSAAEGLVAHLSVLSLRPHPYVDPEDWSPRRVVFLDPIAAGASRTLRWRMTAVDAGTFGVYVTVLPRDPGGGPAPNTPTIDLHVSERRTLNSGGILPLAVAVPALLGGLAIAPRARRRRP
jgi:hypothetical protein